MEFNLGNSGQQKDVKSYFSTEPGISDRSLEEMHWHAKALSAQRKLLKQFAGHVVTLPAPTTNKKNLHR